MDADGAANARVRELRRVRSSDDLENASVLAARPKRRRSRRHRSTSRTHESQDPIGIARHAPLALVHSMMVMITERHQIREIGRTLIDPVHDVVDVGEDVVGTSRKATPTISSLNLTTLRFRGESLCATLEHGVSEGIIDGQRCCTGATDPSNRLAAQESQSLDFGAAGAASQEREVGVDDDEEVRMR